MNERNHVEQRIAEASAQFAAAERAAERWSWSRLLYFALAAVALIVVRPEAGWWILLAIAPFVALVRMHRLASQRSDRWRGALAAARGSLARMDRDWTSIPPLQSIALDGLPNRAAIRDLDLYGERSVFRLLDVCQPGLGGAVTLRWLLENPADLTTIEARQDSVRDLRAQPDYLLESARLCRHGARPGPSDAKLAAFRRWCEEAGERFPTRLVWAARALSVAFIVVLLTIIARPALLQPLSSTLMALIVGQFAVAGLARRYLHARLREASDLLADLGGVVAVLHSITGNDRVGGRFGEMRQELVSSGAPGAFSRLSRLFAWNSAHHSPMLLAALNGLIAFDAHLASRIDDWRETFGVRMPDWIDRVAEAQALTALATMAWENPDWIIPRVHDDASPFLIAERCGHPLIAATVRVTNPVAIDSAGSAIVVSGSNMSGKTTYLRAVGVNALLAFAGGAVCAAAFDVRRCRVRTTVRVEDDLSAGVSLFLAEVSRISSVVSEAAGDRETPVLFLFDEILHGTNAADRRQATQLVLRRLLDSGASGIITTHDPQIAEVGDPARVRQAHFTDSIVPGDDAVSMTFDYTIKSGPATTTNALRILQRLGLG